MQSLAAGRGDGGMTMRVLLRDGLKQVRFWHTADIGYRRPDVCF
jgi:hypothetical protein